MESLRPELKNMNTPAFVYFRLFLRVSDLCSRALTLSKRARSLPLCEKRVHHIGTQQSAYNLIFTRDSLPDRYDQAND